MYVNHKGTYLFLILIFIFNYYWSKIDTCTYLITGFQLTVRNYVKYIDYLFSILKCQYAIYVRLWELVGMHLVLLV